MNINLSSVLRHSRFVRSVWLTQNNGQGASVSIIASMTPASSADVQKLPEGERFHPVFNVFSQSKLSVNDVLSLPDGKRYKIHHVEDWRDNGYYYAQAIRVVGTDKQMSRGFRVK